MLFDEMISLEHGDTGLTSGFDEGAWAWREVTRAEKRGGGLFDDVQASMEKHEPGDSLELPVHPAAPDKDPDWRITHEVVEWGKPHQGPNTWCRRPV